MTTLIPMFVSLVIWLVLWLYMLRLDHRIKELEKNVQ